MSVFLYPRATNDPAVIQVWVGVLEHAGTPSLAWSLDDSAVTVRTARGLQAPPLADNPIPLLTGIYELDAPDDDRDHDLRVTCVTEGWTESQRLRVRRRPATLLDRRFNVLLASCYYARRDEGVARMLSRLPADSRPDLSLLCGDQVYLDLPTLNNLADLTRGRVTGRLTRSYLDNWCQAEHGKYAGVLRAAPAAMIPDDHEFWNNAPHPSPVVPRSWDDGSRRHWTTAARALYDAFQSSEPAGTMLRIDVDPVSIFMLDTRTGRFDNPGNILSWNTMNQFHTWFEDVRRRGWYGVVVTGQSLFQEPAGWWGARIKDRNLSNYADYGTIMRVIRDLARAGRPVLCLTGDVHYGRVLELTETGTGARVVEVISSPTALVDSIGMDQTRRARNLAKHPFRSDPLVNFPRPPQLSGRLDVPPPTGEKGDTRYDVRQLYPTEDRRGNHVAVLSFRRTPAGVDVDIEYHAIAPATTGRPASTVSLALKPTT